jgi:hypothetical protein
MSVYPMLTEISRIGHRQKLLHLELGIFYGDLFTAGCNLILNFQLGYVIKKFSGLSMWQENYNYSLKALIAPINKEKEAHELNIKEVRALLVAK